MESDVSKAVVYLTLKLKIKFKLNVMLDRPSSSGQKVNWCVLTENQYGLVFKKIILRTTVSHEWAVLLAGEYLPVTRQLEVNDSSARSLWKVVRASKEAQSNSNAPEPIKMQGKSYLIVTKQDLEQPGSLQSFHFSPQLKVFF